MNATRNALPISNDSSRRVRRGLLKTPFWTILLVAIALLASRSAYAATYTVTDNSDNASDTGSLRYAVNNATSGSDIINFSGVSGTITLTNGTLTIDNSVTIIGPGAALLTISGNNAATVFTINGATVSMSGLTIANGNGEYSGGIYSEGTLTIDKCAFSGNTATLFGGAIFNQGSLTVNRSTFSGNTGDFAGAIESYFETAVVSNSVFFGNTTGGYGTIYNKSGNLTVNNSTFFGNHVAGGGGISNDISGVLTVNNSTITGNTASSSGGGIANISGTVTLTNSIVAGNTEPTAGDDCDLCGTQGTNNLISTTSSVIAPDLGPLQYNGGTTETMMPLPGSSAIIGQGSGSTLATDQRGFVRSTSGASDLGAVQTDYLTVNTLSDSTETTTCTGGATCSLRDAITLVDGDGSGDVIFQSGLTGTITLASALESIDGNVNLAGPGANLLTIIGVAGNSVLDIPNVNAVVNLSGLTITNQGPGSPSPNGAGLSNEGLLLVENCAFVLNDGQEGGAIFNDTNGSIAIENSTFYNNAATDGGGILNQGLLVVANSTFNDDSDYNGNGGGIGNNGASALALVENSTFSGNFALNGGVGAGIYNSGGLALYNNILAVDTNLATYTEDDCSGCGTPDPSNQIGGTPNLGALAYNGLNAPVQTMIPLPGSPAIQAGVLTLLPTELTTDERGFPRTTGGKLDVGAAQTDYTAVQFVQQPTDTDFNATITPAVTVEVLETNPNLSGPNNTDAVNGIPISLTFSGAGTLSGTLTETNPDGAANFADLSVDTVGTGDTLATSLTVVTGQTLTATSSPFDITLLTQTITFTPPPANVTYGVAPIVLAATSSASLPVTLQVDSGPATIQGNTLTITGAGTVVVEADAAASGNYALAAPVTKTIIVAQAASSLALTSSATQAPTGGTVTLTATATSATSGATATPTGTVTFMANGNSLGTAPLTGGVATLALTTLPAGSNTITASYAGDTNFTGSTAQLTGAIVVGAPTFTMTSSVSNLSIQPGQTGTVTLTLTPSFGYTGTVNFNCGGLPAHSTCGFSPTSVTLNGSPNPVTVTLTVATSVPGQERSSIALLTPLRPLSSLPILPAIFFWLPGTGLALEEDEPNKQPRSKKKSSRMLLAAFLLVLGAGMLSLAGCGGMSNKTPAGLQTVTITATGSGSVSQSITVQLTVS